MGILTSKKSPEYLQQMRNRKPDLVYSLRDEFLTPRLPGAINGTAAEPGPGTRTVVDTLNLLDMGRGRLSVHGLNAVGDPGLWYGSISRNPGVIFKAITKHIYALSSWMIGFDTNQAGAINECAFWLSGGVFRINDGAAGAASSAVFTASTNISYGIVYALRTTGALFFYKDGDTNYKLAWIGSSGVNVTLYPGASFNGLLSDISEISIPKKLWLPAPLLSDGFGTVPDVIDYGGVNDGTPTRVGFGGDARKAFFDGTNSFVDIYSADLNNKFDGAECSAIVRARNDWADASVDYMLNLSVGAFSDGIGISKSGANTITFNRWGGGVTESVVKAAVITTSTMTLGLTVSELADEFKAFYNGAQEGLTQNALGVFAGNLSNQRCYIGDRFVAHSAPYLGWLSDAIILYGVVATPAQMSDIHTHLDAGTMTESWLNSTFGPGTWSWWKLNESYESDGLGHAEGIAGGIGSGGAGLQWEQPIGSFDIVSNALHCSFLESEPLSGAFLAITINDIKTADVIVTCEPQIALCGLALRYVDNANYIRVFHDGGNAVLRQYIGGAPTNLISAAAVFGAGQELRAILEGATARLYYNDVLIGTAVVDSSLVGSTRHGAYGGGINTAVDNLTIYARGTNGEYEILESF